MKASAGVLEALAPLCRCTLCGRDAPLRESLSQRTAGDRCSQSCPPVQHYHCTRCERPKVPRK